MATLKPLIEMLNLFDTPAWTLNLGWSCDYCRSEDVQILNFKKDLAVFILSLLEHTFLGSSFLDPNHHMWEA